MSRGTDQGRPPISVYKGKGINQYLINHNRKRQVKIQGSAPVSESSDAGVNKTLESFSSFYQGRKFVHIVPAYTCSVVIKINTKNTPKQTKNQ